MTYFTIRCSNYDLGLFTSRQAAELYAHLSYGPSWATTRKVVAV
jgi:hypothetical protein